jgi:hypothetical protein
MYIYENTAYNLKIISCLFIIKIIKIFILIEDLLTYSTVYYILYDNSFNNIC